MPGRNVHRARLHDHGRRRRDDDHRWRRRSDDDGRRYAAAHGLAFPFPGDTLDVADGPAQALVLDARTVCTGVILVGYTEPLRDHPVACADLVEVAARRPVPVAVWRVGDRVLQASELYRP